MAWVAKRGLITTRDTSNSSTTAILPGPIHVTNIVVSNNHATDEQRLILESSGEQIFDGYIPPKEGTSGTGIETSVGAFAIPVDAVLEDVEVATGSANLRVTVFYK